MSFLVYLFKKVLKYNNILAGLLSILLSAILFSMFHYIGELGDIFTFKSFYLRTLAGMFLGILYLFRGFGITAYTHIFYDMGVISIPVLINRY